MLRQGHVRVTAGQPGGDARQQRQLGVFERGSRRDIQHLVGHPLLVTARSLCLTADVGDRGGQSEEPFIRAARLQSPFDGVHRLIPVSSRDGSLGLSNGGAGHAVRRPDPLRKGAASVGVALCHLEATAPELTGVEEVRHRLGPRFIEFLRQGYDPISHIAGLLESELEADDVLPRAQDVELQALGPEGAHDLFGASVGIVGLLELPHQAIRHPERGV